MNKKKILFLFLGNRDIKLGLTIAACVKEVERPTETSRRQMIVFFRLLCFSF